MPTDRPGQSDPDDRAAGAIPAELRDRVFIVIAAFNEADVIAEVVRTLRAAWPNVIVVDDGSTDATWAEARTAARWVLRHYINRGQGAALQTGMDFALLRGAEIIVTFDADGQHRWEDVQTLVAPIAAGEVDIVLGSRFLGGAERLPWTRRLVLRAGVLFTRIVDRMPVTDTHNGLRAFSRRAAERISISADRMAHASQLIDLVRLTGLPFREVPVTIRYSDYSMAKGQSSLAAVRIAIHHVIDKILG